MTRIALTGYARSGKDEVANSLIKHHGFTRHSLGDIIKAQTDVLLKNHVGISAFTEKDEEKAVIRPLLEAWSVVNCHGILKAYWDNPPEKFVNNRLVKLDEAVEFKTRGGIIVLVRRPGKKAATEWEHLQLESLITNNMIDFTIDNDSTIAELKNKVSKLVEKLHSK